MKLPIKVLSAVIACLTFMGLQIHPALAVAPRIVGGAPISISQAPWQVAISIRNGTLCGGSLINTDWVITAAHCASGVQPSGFSVFAGLDFLSQRNRGNAISVSQVVIHPDWNGNNFNADLALLQLSAPVTLGPNIQLIPLPEQVDPNTWPQQGSIATISGWGATSFGGSATDQLQAANISVLAGPGVNSCGDYGPNFSALDDLCAGVAGGGIDTCQGDSGSPLTIQIDGVATLAGVTSVGNECALPNFPGIYTRVTTYINWIRGYVPIPATVPMPPVGVTSKAAVGGKVVVSWLPPTSDGGAPITDYNVVNITDPNSAATVCTSQETYCVVTGLQVGVPSSLVVQAVNSVGVSLASDAITATPVTTVLKKGKSISVTRLGKLLKIKKTKLTAKVAKDTASLCRVQGVRVKATKAGVCRVFVKSRGSKKALGTAYIKVV